MVKKVALASNRDERADANPALGRLVVEVDGRRAESYLPARKGRLLLAYLALNRARPVRRDELIAAVWLERPPAEDAEPRPRSLLTSLRQHGALPDPAGPSSKAKTASPRRAPCTSRSSNSSSGSRSSSTPTWRGVTSAG
jgi:hypothetical protein